MKYTVIYRREFEAEVEADDVTEAISSFETGDIKCVGELHQDFFEVLDEKGHHLLEN